MHLEDSNHSAWLAFLTAWVGSCPPRRRLLLLTNASTTLLFLDDGLFTCWPFQVPIWRSCQVFGVWTLLLLIYFFVGFFFCENGRQSQLNRNILLSSAFLVPVLLFLQKINHEKSSTDRETLKDLFHQSFQYQLLWVITVYSVSNITCLLWLWLPGWEGHQVSSLEFSSFCLQKLRIGMPVTELIHKNTTYI